MQQAPIVPIPGRFHKVPQGKFSGEFAWHNQRINHESLGSIFVCWKFPRENTYTGIWRDWNCRRDPFFVPVAKLVSLFTWAFLFVSDMLLMGLLFFCILHFLLYPCIVFFHSFLCSFFIDALYACCFNCSCCWFLEKKYNWNHKIKSWPVRNTKQTKMKL